MDALTAARSMRGSIGMLAMAWLMAPETLQQAAEAGLETETNGAYAVGRLGVLGDCPPDNVVAAAYFWEPDRMREMVTAGRASATPSVGAEVYTGICRSWGEHHLVGMDGVERLGELLEKVVDAASPLGAPTFVGWRDMPRPDDAGPAKTMQLAQTMRELRFGRHCVAVQASGMGPLEAILSGPAGAWNAEFFGWPKPYPEVADLADQRNEIEAMTDRLHADDLAVLSDEERQELRDLAKAARAHATAAADG